MALVEGSGPHLSSETHSLLKVRLRAAAICLFAGSFLFLIFNLLEGSRGPKSYPLLFWSHVTMVVIEGFIGATLCVRCPSKLRKLRLYEAAIFGVPTIFFLIMQWSRVAYCHEIGDATQTITVVRGGVLFWLVLLYLYAMFIPNSWRRAAVNMGVMALLPIAQTIWLRIEYPMVAEQIPLSGVIEMSLSMFIAWGTAVYGVYSIGTLRRQAFEAKQLGQYRLKQLIGAGGMGEVHLAEHQLLKRPCAIKLIRPGQAADPKALARFEREVRAAAKLSHWNSIEIFDYGSTADGTFYYVMEYLPGLDLSTLVSRFGPLPPERAIHLLTQTCDALCEAHEMGLVHRDIKPGNIFSAQRGGVFDVAKLLDFGLVKAASEAMPMQLTQEGGITGSPLYMSPEQAMGEHESDARSDIYSLGAVAYYLLTGQPPFERDRPLKVLFAHAHDEVVPPSQVRPEIPADLEAVVLRCLSKDPDQRFQDAASLKNALEACEASGLWTSADAKRWWEAIPVRCRTERELETSVA
jgi:serine/threonine-protein kinase